MTFRDFIRERGKRTGESENRRIGERRKGESPFPRFSPSRFNIHLRQGQNLPNRMGENTAYFATASSPRLSAPEPLSAFRFLVLCGIPASTVTYLPNLLSTG